jgi:mRNA interferase MazF
MTIVRPGDIWVADIRYTDGSASKKRPILVLWLDANDAVVAAITSAGPRSQADLRLADWRSSGLRTASTVRLSRLDSLEQTLFIHRLGAVSAGDAKLANAIWTLSRNSDEPGYY